MIAWMLYVLMVTLALSVAAFVAERAARLQGSHSRWIWLGAIVASLIVPSVISSVSVQLPNIASPTNSHTAALPLRAVTSNYLSPQIWISEYAATEQSIVELNPVLKTAWQIASVTLAIGLLANGTYLLLRKRKWSQAMFADTAVYVAPDVGPAVVGLLRPCVVIPAWLLNASLERQNAVLAHEQAHLEAGDQRLLTVGLCLLIIMPWNLPLWWQLRRLRYAIEVDCDARVIKKGHPLAEYGETLIEVGERQSLLVGPVAAMSESKSFLEERISIMMRKQVTGWRISATALMGLSLAFVAVAAQVSPPNNVHNSASKIANVSSSKNHVEVAIPPTDFDRFVGTYKLNDKVIVTVTRDGQKFFAQLTGQPAGEIYAESELEFFYKVVDAQITFVAEPQSAATALVLHQNGGHMTAPRVDQAIAKAITAPQTHTLVSFEPVEFDRFVGWYKLSDNMAMNVTRDGPRFYLQASGQHPIEIYPEGNKEFFAKVVNAQVSFLAESQQPATALILHQNGHHVTAPRIDAGAVEQINLNAQQLKERVAAKVKSRAATPGSGAALRRLIDSIIAGQPIYDEMSPELANATRQQLSHLQASVSSLGAIQTIDFIGVGPQGADIYEVRQERGQLQWRISLNANGIIVGALVGPSP